AHVNQVAEQFLFIHQANGFVILAVSVLQHPWTEGASSAAESEDESAGEDYGRPWSLEPLHGYGSGDPAAAESKRFAEKDKWEPCGYTFGIACSSTVFCCEYHRPADCSDFNGSVDSGI